jgi:acetylornithine deacetylase/succinyl-diaminopimelate desuccinylase-like protein
MTTIEPVRVLTERMVRTRSVLPHEEPMARLVADEIRKLGLEPEWHDVTPGRPNVYCSARLGPRDGFVTFTGHLDTVDVAAGWETDPFGPVERDGRLYGLGALDMKSGLACAFTAFERLLRSKDLHPRLGRIGFAATSDEEGLGTGARALLGTEYARSDLMLLTEPFHGSGPDDPIPIAMSGKVLYRIVVEGRTSHALAHPERGINAVDAAARIVLALERLPLGRHPLIGQATCVTLKIDGGYREYAVVVPERCEIIVTRLLVPGETRSAALAQLRRLIDDLGLEARVTAELADPCYEPYEIDPESPAVRAFIAAYTERMGRPPALGGLLCIVDGNIYVAEGGIPTICFGPRGRGLHECQEYVELDTLNPVVDVLVDTAVRFFDGTPTAPGSV